MSASAKDIPFGRGLSTEKWSKKPRRRGKGKVGQKVYTLKELEALSNLGISVVGSYFQRPCPAAWVMSMQARVVCRLLDRGLYAWAMPAKESE